MGRDVRIAPVANSGSTYFATLAANLRGADGRILPALLASYAKSVPAPDRVALAAFSAGHGLLNLVADVAADRDRISAMLLADACFNAGDPKTGQGTPKAGYLKFALDAVAGKRLMVVTTSNATSGEYLSGRQSWELVWTEVQRQTGKTPVRLTPDPIATPKPSGGWWRLGELLYWGDYTVPGSAYGAGSDITHGDHANVLSPKVWSTFLAPYWAGQLGGGDMPWLQLAAGAVAGAVLGYAAHLLGGGS